MLILRQIYTFLLTVLETLQHICAMIAMFLIDVLIDVLIVAGASIAVGFLVAILFEKISREVGSKWNDVSISRGFAVGIPAGLIWSLVALNHLTVGSAFLSVLGLCLVFGCIDLAVFAYFGLTRKTVVDPDWA
jgi:hypothetical protein